MEGSYQLKHFPNKTLQEVEAGSGTEDFNKERKPENKNREINKFEGPFPGFRKNLYEYIVEYSSSTSIQGIRYMGERRRPVFERITWLFFFCVSLYFCIYLTNKAYNKWDTSPVLVSFAKTPTPLWKIPFPAITICPEMKAPQTDYNFTENLYRIEDDPGNMTDEEKNRFFGLAQICHNEYRGGNETIGYDTIDFLENVAPSVRNWICKDVVHHRVCEEILVPIFTEVGVCYTYNMLDRSEVYRDNVFVYSDFMSHKKRSGGWTLGDGYPKNVPIDTYPRRCLSAGLQSQFTIIFLSYEQDFDYVCTISLQGYRIVLHHPAETPQLGTHYYSVSNLQDVTIAIKPEMITTSEDLKHYNPKSRQCYYPEEKYLEFFRSYTQENCELECLTNFTLDQCGCVGIEMPHEKETPICGLASQFCMLDARRDLLRKEVQSGIDEQDLDVDGLSQCDCLPGCTSLVYHAEISQKEFSLDKFMAGARINIDDLDGDQITRLSIYLKEPQFISSERNELYSQTEFLANCGGLLGLFTGFSFLSLVEICYFLSLRIIGNVKRYGRQFWSGSQELVNNDKYDN